MELVHVSRPRTRGTIVDAAADDLLSDSWYSRVSGSGSQEDPNADGGGLQPGTPSQAQRRLDDLT